MHKGPLWSLHSDGPNTHNTEPALGRRQKTARSGQHRLKRGVQAGDDCCCPLVKRAALAPCQRRYILLAPIQRRRMTFWAALPRSARGSTPQRSGAHGGGCSGVLSSSPSCWFSWSSRTSSWTIWPSPTQRPAPQAGPEPPRTPGPPRTPAPRARGEPGRRTRPPSPPV